jgi:hypothetical protein
LPNKPLEPIAARWAAPAQLFVVREYIIMKNNKLTTAIKKWYRGKQAPPLKVMLAGKIHKLPSEEYIQPLVVRLFKKIISSPQTTKQWYEKPFGIVLLMVLGGLIVGYLIYYLGWNIVQRK